MAKRWLIPFVFTVAQAFAQPQIGGGTCSTASLSGAYAVTYAGRQVSTSGTFASVFQAAGMVTFDGQGNAVAALTLNSNTGAAEPITASGTVSISSNCSAKSVFPDGTNQLVVYDQGKAFLFSGPNGMNTSAGSGTYCQRRASLPRCRSLRFQRQRIHLQRLVNMGVAGFTGLLEFVGKGIIAAASWSMISGTTVASGCSLWNLRSEYSWHVPRHGDTGRYEWQSVHTRVWHHGPDRAGIFKCWPPARN